MRASNLAMYAGNNNNQEIEKPGSTAHNLAVPRAGNTYTGILNENILPYLKWPRNWRVNEPPNEFPSFSVTTSAHVPIPTEAKVSQPVVQ